MKLNTNRVIGLYAPQNYGKTHLMSWLLRLIPTDVQIYVYDTNFERLTAYPQNTPNIKFIKAQKPSDQENPAFLDMAILHLRSKGSNFAIVIEDIDKIVSAIKTLETSELFKLASDSRHQRILLIYASKEPTNIPKILRSNTNLFFIGNFIEPQNVKTLSQMVDKQTLLHLRSPQFIMLDRFDNTTTTIEVEGDTLKKIEVDRNAPPVSKQGTKETEQGDGKGDASGNASGNATGRTTDAGNQLPASDTSKEGNDATDAATGQGREHRANTVPTKQPKEPKAKGRERSKGKQRKGGNVLRAAQKGGAGQAARKEGTRKKTKA